MCLLYLLESVEKKCFLSQYRMVEGIGTYWNKRWEIQKKYKYFENDEWIEAWKLVFWCSDKTECEKVFEKYKKEEGKLMKSYEDAILNHQESEKDKCAACEFADTEKCKNQCMEIHSIYNPNLRRK